MKTIFFAVEISYQLLFDTMFLHSFKKHEQKQTVTPNSNTTKI